MTPVTRFHDLTPGKYIIQEYKPIITRKGTRVMIITAIHDNQLVKFWANTRLTEIY